MSCITFVTECIRNERHKKKNSACSHYCNVIVQYNLYTDVRARARTHTHTQTEKEPLKQCQN